MAPIISPVGRSNSAGAAILNKGENEQTINLGSQQVVQVCSDREDQATVPRVLLGNTLKEMSVNDNSVSSVDICTGKMVTSVKDSERQIRQNVHDQIQYITTINFTKWL